MKDAGNETSREALAWRPCLLAVGLYLPLAAASAWMSRYAMNPDGVAYLRTAEYWAKGDWARAINAYWSPLLSWLLVPPIKAGLDPLAAVRVLQVVIGVGFILATGQLAYALGAGRQGQAVAYGCAALAAIPMCRRLITPDLLLACLIAVYLSLASHPPPVRLRRAFATGVVGGVAYLAKAYALPFFLVHHAVSALYWRRQTHQSDDRLRCLATWVVAASGFLMVAIPWVVVISLHSGSPTFSSAGPLNRAFMNPNLEDPFGALYALQLPAAGRLNVWEDPTDLDIPNWSPLENADQLVQQLQWIWSNLGATMRHLKSMDLGGLLLVVWAYALVWAAHPGRPPNARRMVLWTVLSAALYAAGYLLLPDGGARYLWPLVPPGIALLALFLERSPAPSRRLATSLVILSFAATYLFDTYGLWGAWPGKGNYEVAMQVQRLPLEPPLAANAWERGLFVSYHLRLPYLGRPQSKEPHAMVAELRAAGAKTVLVFNDARLSADLADFPGVARLSPVPLEGHDGVILDVFSITGAPG